MSDPSSQFAVTNTIVPLLSPHALIVIGGATATGKSGLAIAIAQRLQASRLNSVILSADSRQVYREFNIGTAKPAIADQRLVPHYLIDICDPTETFTVAEFQTQAETVLSHPERATTDPALPWVPLLVGGTGLYSRAVTKGLVIPRVPPQPPLRSQLQALGQPFCHALLRQVDPVAAAKIHVNDQVRTVRSLEVYYTTGQPMSAQQGERPPAYPILHLGLDCEMDALHQRIAQRTQQMVAAGLVAEVESLCAKYGTDLPLLNTLGYAEFKRYVQGDSSLETAIAETILHTRQFAKRQRTWFRADPEIHWFDATAPDLEHHVWQAIAQFLTTQLPVVCPV